MVPSPTGISDIVELLSKASFFASLLPDDLYWLASKSTLERYEAGEALFRPGETARRFYVVKAGAVAVSRTDESGHSEEMARFVAGDAVGDFDFSRSAVYDAEAACAEPSELLAFPGLGMGMDDLVRERPDVAARILLRSVAMISSRVRSTQALISDNAPWVRELRRQVYTDAATGLWSRSFLDAELPRSLEPPAAVLLVKPDRFKELCDAWTHAAGDAAMERIAAVLKDEARGLGKAWAIRLRSNEAAIVASGCGRAEAEALAERVAAAYRSIDLSAVTGGAGFSLSASIALASWPDDGKDFRGLVEQAYGLLMRAWKDGGYRVYRLADQNVNDVEPEARRVEPKVKR